MGIKFILKKDILDFKAGYTLYIDEHGWGHLGELPWGWEIPFFIIRDNLAWFCPIDMKA